MEQTSASRFLLAGIMALLAGMGCSSDGTPVGEGDDEEGSAREVVLHYDGENLTAPVLGAGLYAGAVRFTPAQVDSLKGETLVGIRYYVKQVPSRARVKVYGTGTNATPGLQLYVADVTDRLAAEQWQTHTLSTPVAIDGTDLWISFEYEDTQALPVLGCDPGPAVENGDWVFNDSGVWRVLSQTTPININWNLRGIVSVRR